MLFACVRRLLTLALLLGLLPEDQAEAAFQRAVPIGPKGRVIKDCEWRFKHSTNRTNDVLNCKKCVKEYDLRFPPRRHDVIQMRQACVPPYTPKEVAILFCSAIHRHLAEESRAKCISCIEEYELPENATKYEEREMDWKCTPHQLPSVLLLQECASRFAANSDNRTDCQRCVNNSGIADNATLAKYKKVQVQCIPRVDPRERIKRLCRWRFIENERIAQCEECVAHYTLPLNYEYEDVWNLRNKCLPRPTKKELLRKTCDWYFKNNQIEKSVCEACVDKSYLVENASYIEEVHIRSVCMPRKSPRERVKDACPRRFKEHEEIEKCRRCADDFTNGQTSNEVHNSDVQQLYRQCLAGNNVKSRLLEECQQKLTEPEVVNKCKDCILRTYKWRIPKHMVREARKRCLLDGFQEN